ncbi:site-2 protease family protein, partial [Priestia megaterium]
MFGLNDLPKFVWSFCLVLPLVSFVHQLGHSVMAIIFGGKVDFTIGRGKTILKMGKFKIKSVYFLDSFCKYENLKNDSRISHAVVYAGGVLFNVLTIFIINGLIMANILPEDIFCYQFVYFSVYYVIFSLLPIQYTETS